MMLLLVRVADAQSIEELKRLTLEEMLALEVNTVSRSPEPAGLAPAAIFVITRDDIRRSGATMLAEVLRMAPGVHVAQIDSFRWAVGMRGLADRLSRSILVLIDGRPVYNPLFAGTYWEIQDYALNDIDRIEVIRGPGGTLWGANAVNGIISIVTRSAEETQGVLAHGLAGDVEHGVGTFRYGTTAGDNGHIRGYLKTFGRGPQFHASGADFDDWWKVQGGVRGDWRLEDEQRLTIQGDAYTSRLGQRQVVTSADYGSTTAQFVDAPVSGMNMAARWSGGLPAGAAFTLHAFYDRTHRDEEPVGETRNTIGLDYQQRQQPWRRHQLTWGIGYRLSADDIVSVGTSEFDPSRFTDHLFSAFAEDEFPLLPSLVLSAGSKIERNSYSGFELQPSARVTWQAAPAHTIVASVAHAVRTPSRVERHYTTGSLVDPAVPSFVRLLPSANFTTEKLTAYELGYRVRPSATTYFTVSGFYNTLDDLLTTELLTAFAENGPPPRLILPVIFRNGLHGHSQGVETTADVRPWEWWRTTFNYSYLDVVVDPEPGSTDVTQERANEGRVPHHQVQLRTAIDLPGSVSVDWLMRHVSELNDGNIPSYATSDVRVGWQPNPWLEFFVVGKNLHDAHHPEWPGGIQVRRSFFVAATLRR